MQNMNTVPEKDEKLQTRLIFLGRHTDLKLDAVWPDHFIKAQKTNLLDVNKLKYGIIH